MKIRDSFFQVLLFLSGLAALLYQVVWQRALTQAIGVDEIAIVFIVTIFMLGLGFGAFAGGLAARLPLRKLPAIYAGVEIGIAVFGAVSLPVLRGVNAWFAQFNVDSVTADFMLNCAVLFGPIFLMGMTTPIAIQVLKDRLDNFGESIGRFYGANVLGAAFGALLSLPLIELFSLRGAVATAVFLNLLIGILFVLGFRWKARNGVEASPQTHAGHQTIRPAAGVPPIRKGPLYLGVFCFGFANLAVQIIAIRLLVNYMSPLSYLFPVALAAYLMLMALGQSFGGAWVDRLSPSRRSGFVGLLAACIVLSFVLVTNVPYAALDMLRPAAPFWRVEFILTFALPLALIFMLPAFFASAFLPVMTRIRAESIESAGSSFGEVLFWSTAGNIAGSFLVGVFLFEYIGAIYSITVTVLVLVAGVMCTKLVPGAMSDAEPPTGLIESASDAIFRSRRVQAYGVTVILLLLFVAIPRDYFRQGFASDRDFTTGFKTSQPIVSMEGRTGITSIYGNREIPYRFEVRPANSGAAAAIAHDSAAYYRYYSLSAPMALDPGFRPKRILQIGMGSGEFPFVMKEMPGVEHIDVVELIPEVVRAYERFSHPAIRETIRHPKVKFHVTDGRRFLQKALAQGKKYDFIQVGVTGLASSGISNMYSSDLFRRIPELLNPGGYVALEPYVSHTRLLFEFFTHGYVLDGSSWIFFSNKDLALKDGELKVVEEPVLRAMKAMTLAEMRTPLSTERCTADKISIAYVKKDQVVPRFNRMLGTDDYLPFEYFYIGQYRRDYLYPGTYVWKVPGAMESTLTINIAGKCSGA